MWPGSVQLHSPVHHNHHYLCSGIGPPLAASHGTLHCHPHNEATSTRNMLLFLGVKRVRFFFFLTLSLLREKIWNS